MFLSGISLGPLANIHRENTSVTAGNISFKDVSTFPRVRSGSSLKRDNGHSDYIQFIYHVLGSRLPGYRGESSREGGKKREKKKKQWETWRPLQRTLARSRIHRMLAKILIPPLIRSGIRPIVYSVF